MAVGLKESDYRWLAAVVDIEGALMCERQIQKRSNGTIRKGYYPRLKVVMTDKIFIDEICRLVGGSRVFIKRCDENRKDQWCIHLNGGGRVNEKGLRFLLPKILPYLIIKGKQAELLIELCFVNNGRRNRPKGSTKGNYLPESKRGKEIYLEMKKLNRRGCLS